MRSLASSFPVVVMAATLRVAGGDVGSYRGFTHRDGVAKDPWDTPPETRARRCPGLGPPLHLQ